MRFYSRFSKFVKFSWARLYLMKPLFVINEILSNIVPFIKCFACWWHVSSYFLSLIINASWPVQKMCKLYAILVNACPWFMLLQQQSKHSLMTAQVVISSKSTGRRRRQITLVEQISLKSVNDLHSLRLPTFRTIFCLQVYHVR